MSAKPLIPESKQAQPVMAATFEFKYDDRMIATDGTEIGFGGGLGATSKKIKIMNLPEDAVILTGRLITLEKFSTAPTLFQLGDETTATKLGTFSGGHFTAVGVNTSTTTTLTAANAASLTNEEVYLTLTVANNLTSGRAIVEFEYIVPGRATENTR